MEVSQTMLNVGACVLAGVIAYLLGSISFAIIVSRIYAHDDVRKYGSKNAGMTNILRTYGKMPAFLRCWEIFSKAFWRLLLEDGSFRSLASQSLTQAILQDFLPCWAICTRFILDSKEAKVSLPLWELYWL